MLRLFNAPTEGSRRTLGQGVSHAWAMGRTGCYATHRFEHPESTKVNNPFALLQILLAAPVPLSGLILWIGHALHQAVD